MWTWYRRQRSKMIRRAPYGSKPPTRADRPPDGWKTVDSSSTERLAELADRALFSVTGRALEEVSRRNFLGKSAKAGLALGLATMPLWRSNSAVLAHGEPCNVWDTTPQSLPGACGPSPLCWSSHCNSNKQCHLAHPPTKRRTYTGSTCTCNSCNNCWTEHCCTQNGYHWRCCDCCESHPNTSLRCSASSCDHTDLSMNKCICRKRLEAC